MLLAFLQDADACFDWISVHRMDLIRRIYQRIQPFGFWGEKEAAPLAGQDDCSAGQVYLTFDDGPSPQTTPWLLELLEAEGVKASFFLIGKEAERYPELALEIKKAGHMIGNHSYSHMLMPALTTGKMEKEIERTNKIIEEICGEPPSIFRPPFGLMCPRTLQILSEREMHPIHWTEAPEDWERPGAKRVVRRVLMKMAAGSLIVLHEGPALKEQTIAATNELIYSCKSANLVLAKVKASA